MNTIARRRMHKLFNIYSLSFSFTLFTALMDGSHRSKRFCVLLALTLLSTFVQLTTAQVTIYGQIPLAQLRAQQRQTDDPVAIAFEPTSSAYDRTRLIPPALPAPMPATTFTIELPREATTAQQLSIPHTGGAFYGFSIEMSVLNQVGTNLLSNFPKFVTQLTCFSQWAEIRESCFSGPLEDPN